MGLVDIQVRVHIAGPLLKLAQLERIDFSRVFGGLRKPARADQIDHRNRMRGPRGPWPALAPSTLERYARAGKRRNRRILGRLPVALQSIVSHNSLVMRSRVKWSMAHQAGPTRVGHGSILPQRQFLWISARLRDKARSMFEDALYSRWRR